MSKLNIIGIGPGGYGSLTFDAYKCLEESELIVAYTPYLEYIRGFIKIEEKRIYTSGMTQEIERCRYAVEEAAKGVLTSIISTGDAGLYGMAGPCFEIADEKGLLEDLEINVIPGVSAVFAAASELGAPLMHDSAIISLSDLLTPIDLILKRVEMAARGDFVIAIYNPRSKKRPDNLKWAIDIIREHRSAENIVGIVRNAGRDGMDKFICKLDEIDYEKVDMMSTLIIGNSQTREKNGKMITPRGYENK
ncbi:MAG: precorrin-3B C(17)-methyltransferase [Tissierellia bacterium]|nr:precorrin-3B C(17)-methyltransferase [Tissierellia bacterium]